MHTNTHVHGNMKKLKRLTSLPFLVAVHSDIIYSTLFLILLMLVRAY